MEYLTIEHASKSYGEKVLFEDLSMTISKGEKIAIIAKNGSGKSTLLKVIAGLETAEGERAVVRLNRTVRTAFLDQEPDFNPEDNVMQVLLDMDNEVVKAIKNYQEAVLHDRADQIEEALSQMEEFKAWAMEAKIKEVLFKLNLTDLDQKIGTLSGGQKKRLALAKIIIDEPDFLILDEPTNHIDIEMIEWLEKYLQSSALTLLMVTHDRYFLERVCNQIIELDKGKIWVYRGNYSDYLEKKAMRSHQDQQSLDKAKKLLSKELEWVRRQPKARGTKAKSRVDSFHKLDEHVSSISYDEIFQIDVDTARLGKKIVEFYDASKSYGDRKMLEGFWYKFKKGERVGISGANGTGKSTFIKLITGEERLTSGKRVIGETVLFGHYQQDGIQLDHDKRVIDVIRSYGEYIPLKKGQKLSAARLLETFMFPPFQHQVFVSQLSGGERKRLHLLCVLMGNPNFLILDEPTNDLDVLTLNVLEDYLSQFPGCLVIISHDRFFMDKLVDHMFIFKGEGDIKDFNGTYSEWKRSQTNYSSNSSDSSIQTPKDIVEENEEESPERKLSYKEKMEIKSLEKDLENLEKRRKEIEALFIQGSLENGQINELSIELGTIKSQTDEKEFRWLELSEIEG